MMLKLKNKARGGTRQRERVDTCKEKIPKYISNGL